MMTYIENKDPTDTDSIDDLLDGFNPGSTADDVLIYKFLKNRNLS